MLLSVAGSHAEPFHFSTCPFDGAVLLTAFPCKASTVGFGYVPAKSPPAALPEPNLLLKVVQSDDVNNPVFEPSAFAMFIDVPLPITAPVPPVIFILAFGDVKFPVLVVWRKSVEFNSSNKSAFKLFTKVVELTVNGEVPVFTVEVKVGAVTLLEKVLAPAIVCAWSSMWP